MTAVGDYYTIQTDGHHSELFVELHALQKQGVLCDVILAAEDGEVMAHKVVLMAASKYFREKLSPVVSGNPSKICLKGISVMELANLVKYIYTGKLLVAKETMDVTLEVSEILQLTGVTQGYRDIVMYEQMQSDLSGANMTGSSHGKVKDGRTSNTAGTAGGEDATTKTHPGVQPDDHATQAQLGPTQGQSTMQKHIGTTTNLNEYQFEFNPYDQQYMDVSVGSNNQANLPRLHKNSKSDKTVSEEQARHQDLLTVAIETLSDPSHFIGGIPKHSSETEAAIASVNPENAVPVTTQAVFQNGLIESKIVTLNAGTVANELGGHTSVYTVALDPSSITKPLLMPRVMRKKTEKEKLAEMAAKKYRKKKADLLNRTNIITAVIQSDDDNITEVIQYPAPDAIVGETIATEGSIKGRRIPKILMRSSSPKKKDMTLPDQLQHIMIHRAQDGKVTTSKLTRSEGQIVSPSVTSEAADIAAAHAKGEFGQVVNFDSDADDDSCERTAKAIKKEKQIMDTHASLTEENQFAFRTRAAVRKEKGKSISAQIQVNSINEKVDLSEIDNSPDRSDNNQSPAFDNQDSQIADRTRSSATKRKGKIPRRLQDPDSTCNIPLVRTRKSSRTESGTGNSKNVRTARAKSLNLDSSEASSRIEEAKSSSNIQQDQGAIDGSKSRHEVYSEGNSEEEASAQQELIYEKLQGDQDSTLERRQINTSTSSEATIYKRNVISENSSEKGSELDLEKTVDTVPDIRQGKGTAEQEVKVQMKGRMSRTQSVGTACDDTEKMEEEESKVGKDAPPSETLLYMCPETNCRYLGGSVKTIRRHQAAVHGPVQQRRSRSPDLQKFKVIFQKRLMETSNTATPAHVKEECEICAVQFLSQYDLLTHQAKLHGGPIPKACKSYSCPKCGFIADTFKTMDTHLAKHEGNHVQCFCCEKSFKTFADMRKHLIHHSEKRYKCQSCDFMSNVPSCVATHFQLKHVEEKKTVHCQFCSYETPLPGNMRKHILKAHELTVVTKQSHENRDKYKDFEEGQLLTKEGTLFDPETMKVPKMSKRKFSEEPVISEEESRYRDGEKKRRALSSLSSEEFTKEVLKRHQEYLKKPEKSHKFMSQSLAQATATPSFPQASPSVRRTKADRIYHAPKAAPRLQDLSSAGTIQYVSETASTVPTAVNEIEVAQHDSDNSECGMHTVISMPEGTGEMEQIIVVTNDGKESVMPTKDFYSALMQRENSQETKNTIGVINALLAAGQEVQLEERDLRHVDIQNE